MGLPFKVEAVSRDSWNGARPILSTDRSSKRMSMDLVMSEYGRVFYCHASPEGHRANNECTDIFWIATPMLPTAKSLIPVKVALTLS